MARRAGLTDNQIANKKRKPKRYIKADPEQRGLYLRIPPEGPIVFAAVARDPYGKQIWATLGTTAELTIDQARDRAREAIHRVKAGKPAIEPPKVQPDTVAAVTANWFKRHVEKNGLRTAAEIRRMLDVHVLPRWRDRIFVELKRRDIAALLDAIEDDHGAPAADAVLTVLRSIATWQAARDDNYTPPFVRGMRRISKAAQRRSRILTDDEIRKVWKAVDDAQQFGAGIRFLLLTGQRRDKAITLRWEDIDDNGTWKIRTEAREQSNAGSLQLPQAARDIVAAQPRFTGEPIIFGRSLRSFRWKKNFDKKCGVTDWVIHDLRRTARSLLSRVGVSTEIAERVLGHAVTGVRGTYDRHDYEKEKADALRKLAALIERIVNPPAENIVALHEAAL